MANMGHVRTLPACERITPPQRTIGGRICMAYPGSAMQPAGQTAREPSSEMVSWLPMLLIGSFCQSGMRVKGVDRLISSRCRVGSETSWHIAVHQHHQWLTGRSVADRKSGGCSGQSEVEGLQTSSGRVARQ